MKFTRYVLPVVVGVMSGMILIVLGNNLIDKIYPPPPGTDKYDADSVNKALSIMPQGGFAMLAANYAICALLAGIISSFVSGRTESRPPLIVGFVLTLSGLYYVINFKLPLWFAIANLVVYLPCAYLGYLVVKKKTVY